MADVFISAMCAQDIMEKPWYGWKAPAKRYFRMYSSLVANYSPSPAMSGSVW